jgi:hypothetical protein
LGLVYEDADCDATLNNQEALAGPVCEVQAVSKKEKNIAEVERAESVLEKLQNEPALHKVREGVTTSDAGPAHGISNIWCDDAPIGPVPEGALGRTSQFDDLPVLKRHGEVHTSHDTTLSVVMSKKLRATGEEEAQSRETDMEDL